MNTKSLSSPHSPGLPFPSPRLKETEHLLGMIAIRISFIDFPENPIKRNRKERLSLLHLL
jgi:hypothetical protein